MDKELMLALIGAGHSTEAAFKAIKSFKKCISTIEHGDCIKARRNKSDRKRGRANRWR